MERLLAPGEINNWFVNVHACFMCLIATEMIAMYARDYYRHCNVLQLDRFLLLAYICYNYIILLIINLVIDEVSF